MLDYILKLEAKDIATHKRSEKKLIERATRKKIKRELRDFILTTSFRDQKINETVCTLTHNQITYYGKVTFGDDFDRHEESMIYPFYCDCDDGTVLTDSYGRGVFQRV